MGSATIAEGATCPIYADATLGVTTFRLQHNSAGTWVNTTNLKTNQKYRFRACFRNFAPDTFDSPMFGPKIYVTDLSAEFTLSGARFDYSGQSTVREAITSYPEVDGHRNFNDLIKPQRSRWDEFGYFTWIGPSGPVSQHPVEFSTLHREIRWVGIPPRARLVPT
jgi:hypothetical protein